MPWTLSGYCVEALFSGLAFAVEAPFFRPLRGRGFGDIYCLIAGLFIICRSVELLTASFFVIWEKILWRLLCVDGASVNKLLF